MRHLQIYRAIRAIVQQGSFRKAAELLTISPSALNRQVKALEADLGVELFDRLPVGVRLSTIGEIYYRVFSNHLAEIEGAMQTVSAMQGVRIGHVKIAVSPELTQGFLQDQIEHYRNAHPGIQFTVVLMQSDRFSACLAEGEADLALILQPQDRRGINLMCSVEVPLVGLVHANSPIGADLKSQDFLVHDVVLPSAENGLRIFLETAFRSRNLSLQPAVIVDYRIVPVGGGRSSLQFWPEIDLNEAWLNRSQARAVKLHRMPLIQVSLCQSEGRVLSMAAAGFSQQVIDALGG